MGIAEHDILLGSIHCEFSFNDVDIPLSAKPPYPPLPWAVFHRLSTNQSDMETIHLRIMGVLLYICGIIEA